MHDHIPDSDWNILREINRVALDRFCQRVLEEITAIANDHDLDKGSHAKYGTIYRLIQDRDKDIEEAFDDLKRENAIFKIAIMKRRGLIHDDELGRFSQDTLDCVAKIDWLAA